MAIDRGLTQPTSFIPMEAVDEVHGTATPTLRPFSEVRKGYTSFQNGDVLFAKITPCMQNGKHIIAANLVDSIGFGTTEFHVVRPGPMVSAIWIHRFLRQAATRAQAAEAFTGAVGQQRVPPEFLRSLQIPLPPISEQRRIAAKVDEAIADVAIARDAVAAQRRECDTIRLEFINAAFHGRAIVTSEDAGAGWIPLTEVAKLESGHTPSRRRPEWWGGDVPWIALPDIRALDGTTAQTTAEATNELGLANSSARLLPEGTVVLSRTASVGFVTVMGRPMATSQDFVNWVPGPKLRPWFLAYALIGARDYLRGLSSGAVHKTIYMPTLKGLHIRLPSLAEQDHALEQIRTAHESLGTAMAALEQQAAAVEALPQALLSAAFKGEL